MKKNESLKNMEWKNEKDIGTTSLGIMKLATPG